MQRGDELEAVVHRDVDEHDVRSRATGALRGVIQPGGGFHHARASVAREEMRESLGVQPDVSDEHHADRCGHGFTSA
jgi:hypothetical protein